MKLLRDSHKGLVKLEESESQGKISQILYQKAYSTGIILCQKGRRFNSSLFTLLMQSDVRGGHKNLSFTVFRFELSVVLLYYPFLEVATNA